MSRVVIVAAACLTVALAGCGSGKARPSAPPTGEAALTVVTAEPEVVEQTAQPGVVQQTAGPETEEPVAAGPPEIPEEATAQTEAGAEAFVEHYIEVLDDAYATGEVDQLTHLAGPGCDSCAALVQDLPSNPDQEETFTTTDGPSAQMIGTELARVETRVTVLRGPGQGDGGLVFDLSRDGEGWVVDAIRLQDAP